MLFELKNKNNDNGNKKIGFIICNLLEKYFYLFGFSFILEEYFKKKGYDVYWIGIEKNYNKFNNFYKLNLKYFNDKIKPRLLRKKDGIENYVEKNKEILINEIKKSFTNITFEKFFIFNDVLFQLPLQCFSKEFKNKYNEFHDYIGNDNEYINKIDSFITKLNYDKKCSLTSYMFGRNNIFFNLLRYFKVHTYGFIIDPTFFYQIFEKNEVPFTPFYFVDDNRGTRNFKKFPIAELQHCIYDYNIREENILTINENNSKSKDFLFYGTIIQKKGYRKNCWNIFLKDLNIDNSDYFIPLRKNGIITNNSKYTCKKIKDAKEKYIELWNEIKYHPLYSGHFKPIELNNILEKYKYSLILRCVSLNDSLNYRPIKYLCFDVLPFFDYKYDPTFLQIPEKFQKKLTVYNAQDIEKLVNYYNNNDQERLNLLKEMKEYFKIDKWKNNKEFAFSELDKYF